MFKYLKFAFIKSKVFIIAATIAGIGVFSCVEEFDPQIIGYGELLVIDGSVIKGEDMQKVVVSRSTTIADPEYIPVSGCEVIVIDDKGNEFPYAEGRPGEYKASIPQEYLSYNSKFQLQVTTPNQNVYQSSFEPLFESSPIDSIYYIDESKQTSTDVYDHGLQFYTDLKAPDDATKNYLWQLQETWEIRTSYEIEGSWKVDDYFPPWYNPIDSLRVCWSNADIKESYTSSTENLVVNEKKKIPLSYIPATSTKLNVRYSMLVKQYSLSDEAYAFHKQANINEETGSLYQAQPDQSKSNLVNINNPGETVLGFFWASSYTEKRVFFDGPLTTYNDNHCKEIIVCEPAFGQSLISYFRSLGRDLYLIALSFDTEKTDSVTSWGFPSEQICIDCTAEGGSTVKPNFW